MIIKKLNAVFHRHSRWLFGAFTVVIIVSFLGFLTPGTFGLDSITGDTKVGSCYGKDVTYNDLRHTSQKMAVFVELLYGGQMRNMDNREVFNQYCLLAKARNMGITADNKEVADLIRKVPAFQTNGEFDPAKRRTVLKNLRANGITEDVINESFKDQVVISKLQRDLSSGITVSENEIETLFRSAYAVNQVKVAEFKAKAPAVNTLKADEVKKFFESSREKYMVPGSVGALIVVFPYSKYRTEAEKAAGDVKLLEQFFRNNIASFSTEKKPAPRFAEVKAAVAAKFIAEHSRYLARKAGYDFASSVYDESNGKDEKVQLATFKSKAVAAKYNVISAKPVKFDSDSIANIKNSELIRQLTHVSPGSLVTNAVNGDNAVYVAIAKDRKMPRKAEFKEVEQQVKRDCAAAVGRKNAQLAAQKAFGELMRITDVSKREAALAKIAGKQLKSISFSMAELPNDPVAYGVAQMAGDLKVGNPAAPFPFGESSMLALPVKRIPADMKKFASEKAKFAELIRNRKLQLAILAVQEDMNSNCVFAELVQQ